MKTNGSEVGSMPMEHATSEANASEAVGLARTDSHHQGTTSDWDGLGHHENLAESDAQGKVYGRSVDEWARRAIAAEAELTAIKMAVADLIASVSR
jgi:hypothetical protein